MVGTLEGHAALQLAVDGIARWCKDNRMQLLLPETVVLKYGREELDYYIDGNLLATAECARDLGLQMNNGLDFSQHLNMTVKSALMLVNSMLRYLIVKRPDMYIRMYKTLIFDAKLISCLKL